MGFKDWLRKKVIDLIGDSAQATRIDEIFRRREYRVGVQREFIRVRPNQANDNIVANFTSLVVDRSVSMMLGDGVTVDYGEGQEQAQEYIEDVLEFNQWDIFMHKLSLYGAEAGMCFVKIKPDQEDFPRLIPLDPVLMDIKTNPDDMDYVLEYVIQYKIEDENGREISRKEVTALQENGTWLITNYISRSSTSGQWVQDGEPIQWQYDFPPIVHWQNMPMAGDVWGMPDITDDVIRLQDRINFVASNMSKIVRIFAHPQRYGVGLGSKSELDLSPDSMPNYTSGEIKQLEQLGDMVGSRDFLLWLRQALFDITRTVDISSMADKLGALTNFGLHVLYQDALAKNDTKRLMYQYGIKEMCRRLLELNGMEPVDCKVKWSDPLPENETEEVQSITADLGNGIVSKQTASELRGYVWEDEQALIAEQSTQEDNLGSTILRAFDRNGGVNT